MPLRDILLLTIFIGSLPVCFVRPFYGICMWTIVAFLNPQSFVWTVAWSFPWAMIIAVPTMAGFFLFTRGWMGLVFSGKALMIVVLWTWFTITSFVSTHTPLLMHHAVDTWERWEFVSKVILMTMVTISMLVSFSRLRMLMLVMAGSFGFYVLKAAPFVILTGGGDRVYGPENSMVADNNDFGLAMNMSLPLFYGLAQTESKTWLKRLLTLMFVCAIPATVFTYSRGALVGLIIVLGMLFLNSRKKFLLIPVLVMFALLALLFAPEKWVYRMDPTRKDAVDGSAKSRLNNWTYAYRLASDYPITGGGFATFTPELYDLYSPARTKVYGPHSIYFQILGEHGFTGLFMYLGFLVACLLTTLRLARHARLYDDTVVLNYATMLKLSLLAFIISGTFLGRAYFDYFFSLAACVIALERQAEERWTSWEDEEATEEEPSMAMMSSLHPASELPQ